MQCYNALNNVIIETDVFKEKTADNVKRSIGSEERNDSSCGGDHCLPESFASECSSNVSEIPQQSFHSHEPLKSPFQVQQVLKTLL